MLGRSGGCWWKGGGKTFRLLYFLPISSTEEEETFFHLVKYHHHPPRPPSALRPRSHPPHHLLLFDVYSHSDVWWLLARLISIFSITLRSSAFSQSTTIIIITCSIWFFPDFNGLALSSLRKKFCIRLGKATGVHITRCTKSFKYARTYVNKPRKKEMWSRRWNPQVQRPLPSMYKEGICASFRR